MIYRCARPQTWLVGFGQCTSCDDSAVSSTEGKNDTAPAPSQQTFFQRRGALALTHPGENMPRLLMKVSLKGAVSKRLTSGKTRPEMRLSIVGLILRVGVHKRVGERAVPRILACAPWSLMSQTAPCPAPREAR